jgi:hypothetical protein
MTQRNVKKMAGGEFERLRRPGEQLFDVALVHKAPKAPVANRAGRTGDDRLIGEVIDDYLAATPNFTGWLFLTDQRLACSGVTAVGLFTTESKSWEVSREDVVAIERQRRTGNPLGDRFWPFTITFSDDSSLWLRSSNSEIKALITALDSAT